MFSSPRFINLLCVTITTDGRKPIYIVSLPIFTLGSLGVGLSTNLAGLIAGRIIQGKVIRFSMIHLPLGQIPEEIYSSCSFLPLHCLRIVGIGSSAVLSVGAGTIGDLYPRSQRGAAMGWFYSGVLVGPAMAPAIAGPFFLPHSSPKKKQVAVLMKMFDGSGVLTQYAIPSGWRAMQYLLAGMGLIASLLVIFLLPETIHFKGVDIIREERKQARLLKGVESGQNSKEGSLVEGKGSRWSRWVGEEEWVVLWLNPLAPLKLLIHPHILAIVHIFLSSVQFRDLLADRLIHLNLVTQFKFHSHVDLQCVHLLKP